LEEIQIIRGAASLQYGTQFGGLVNFKLKNPTENLLNLPQETLGSYGLYTNFTSISGTNKSLVITVSIITKRNGFRPNSDFE
jgi:Fe(3+) dicitrate transport protein